MPGFLIDEDLPRSLAPAVRGAGHECADVRDVDLRGAHDDEVVRHAVANEMVLITGDVGIGSILRYPLGSHHGIILVRLANEEPTEVVISTVLRALASLPASELFGGLVVVTKERVRVRRPRSS